MSFPFWAAFLFTLFGFLAVDLLRHRGARVVSLRDALFWTGVWVALGLGFAVVIALTLGAEATGEYVAGYLIEWSLSVDNVFVFVLIFTQFAVPAECQHRVLFWGVIGAIFMRLSFILAGSALLSRFHWIIYIFGGVLLVTAVRLLLGRESKREPGDSLTLRVVRRVVPLTNEFRGARFFVREGGRTLATPLFAVLVLIEASDVVFAVDSVPAVFAVTRNAFVAFTSNAMAILGLRSLYFVLSHGVTRFRFLKPALAAVLTFVAAKMLLSGVVEIPVWLSLSVIVGILGLAVAASVLAPPAKERAGANL